MTVITTKDRAAEKDTASAGTVASAGTQELHAVVTPKNIGNVREDEKDVWLQEGESAG